MTNGDIYQFWAAYTLTMLGLGFWLGRRWHNWQLRRAQAMLDLERSYNQGWRGGR